jgi:predicted DNA-binding transcriptional regulator AlpA
MSQRIIRLSELASFPAQEAQSAQEAKGGESAKKAKPAKSAKVGKLPVSSATIWRWVREGKFPKPFKLSDSVTVWDEDEIDAFIAKRAAEA